MALNAELVDERAPDVIQKLAAALPSLTSLKGFNESIFAPGGWQPTDPVVAQGLQTLCAAAQEVCVELVGAQEEEEEEGEKEEQEEEKEDKEKEEEEE